MGPHSYLKNWVEFLASYGGRKPVFIRCCPDRSTTLQWKAPYLSVNGQHKTKLMVIDIFKKGGNVGNKKIGVDIGGVKGVWVNTTKHIVCSSLRIKNIY